MSDFEADIEALRLVIKLQYPGLARKCAEPIIKKSSGDCSSEENSAEEGAITSARIMEANKRAMEAKLLAISKKKNTIKRRKPVAKNYSSTSDSDISTSDSESTSSGINVNRNKVCAKSEAVENLSGKNPKPKFKKAKKNQQTTADASTETTADYLFLFSGDHCNLLPKPNIDANVNTEPVVDTEAEENASTEKISSTSSNAVHSSSSNSPEVLYENQDKTAIAVACLDEPNIDEVVNTKKNEGLCLNKKFSSLNSADALCEKLDNKAITVDEQNIGEVVNTKNNTDEGLGLNNISSSSNSAEALCENQDNKAITVNEQNIDELVNTNEGVGLNTISSSSNSAEALCENQDNKPITVDEQNIDEVVNTKKNTNEGGLNKISSSSNSAEALCENQDNKPITVDEQNIDEVVNTKKNTNEGGLNKISSSSNSAEVLCKNQGNKAIAIACSDEPNIDKVVNTNKNINEGKDLNNLSRDLTENREKLKKVKGKKTKSDRKHKEKDDVITAKVTSSNSKKSDINTTIKEVDTKNNYSSAKASSSGKNKQKETTGKSKKKDNNHKSLNFETKSTHSKAILLDADDIKSVNMTAKASPSKTSNVLHSPKMSSSTIDKRSSAFLSATDDVQSSKIGSKTFIDDESNKDAYVTPKATSSKIKDSDNESYAESLDCKNSRSLKAAPSIINNDGSSAITPNIISSISQKSDKCNSKIILKATTTSDLKESDNNTYAETSDLRNDCSLVRTVSSSGVDVGQSSEITSKPSSSVTNDASNKVYDTFSPKIASNVTSSKLNDNGNYYCSVQATSSKSNVEVLKPENISSSSNKFSLKQDNFCRAEIDPKPSSSKTESDTNTFIEGPNSKCISSSPNASSSMVGDNGSSNIVPNTTSSNAKESDKITIASSSGLDVVQDSTSLNVSIEAQQQELVNNSKSTTTKQKKSKKSKKSKSIKNNEDANEENKTNNDVQQDIITLTSSKKKRLNAKRRAAAKKKAAASLAAAAAENSENTINAVQCEEHLPIDHRRVLNNFYYDDDFNNITTDFSKITTLYTPSIFTSINKTKLPTIPELPCEQTLPNISTKLSISGQENTPPSNLLTSSGDLKTNLYVPENSPSNASANICFKVACNTNQLSSRFDNKRDNMSYTDMTNKSYASSSTLTNLLAPIMETSTTSPNSEPCTSSTLFADITNKNTKTTLKRKAPTEEVSTAAIGVVEPIYDTPLSVNTNDYLPIGKLTDLSSISLKSKKTNLKRRVNVTEKNYNLEKGFIRSAYEAREMPESYSLNAKEKFDNVSFDNNAGTSSNTLKISPEYSLLSDITPSIENIGSDADIELYKETVNDYSFNEVDTKNARDNTISTHDSTFDLTANKSNLLLKGKTDSNNDPNVLNLSFNLNNIIKREEVATLNATANTSDDCMHTKSEVIDLIPSLSIKNHVYKPPPKLDIINCPQFDSATVSTVNCPINKNLSNITKCDSGTVTTIVDNTKVIDSMQQINKSSIPDIMNYVPSGCENAALPSESANIGTSRFTNASSALDTKNNSKSENTPASASQCTVYATLEETTKNTNKEKEVNKILYINEGPSTSKEAECDNESHEIDIDTKRHNTSQTSVISSTSNSDMSDEEHSWKPVVAKSESASEVGLLKHGKGIKLLAAKRRAAARKLMTEPGVPDYEQKPKPKQEEYDIPVSIYSDNLDLD